MMSDVSSAQSAHSHVANGDHANGDHHAKAAVGDVAADYGGAGHGAAEGEGKGEGEDDGGGDRDGDGAAPHAVHVTRVGVPGVLGGLMSLVGRTQYVVSYHAHELPTGVTSVDAHALSPPPASRAAPALGACSLARVGGWIFNACLLWGALLWLRVTLASRPLQPALLVASAIDDETWVARVREATLLSLLNSLLLIDSVKVLCLTCTSKPALVVLCGCGDSDGKLHGALGLVRRLLRRTHKLLDVLL
jgi:hypothetical protein